MGGIGILLAILASQSGIPQPPESVAARVQVERLAISNGGELLTFYRQFPHHADVPVVAVLRDTMGDSADANNRLRYVWVLTDRRAPWYKHVLAALPFLYTRMPSPLPSAAHRPNPVLDLGKPADRSVAALAKSVLQTQAFDPMGVVVRTSTRSYQQNEEFRRQTRVAEALATLADTQPFESSPLSTQDMQTLRARLLLSTKTLGGWVGEEGLARVYATDVTQVEEMRGHNWDLLRQAAELNGLEFEPIRLAGGPPAHALLWVSKEDVETNTVNKQFHGRFLGIAKPWGDQRLTAWKGYTEIRQWLGQPTEMIPLALYSLDHPKVPQLVADMRDSFAPGRREMVRRAVTDATAGVLGVTRTANIGLFAASYTYGFISSRWGASNNRSRRVRSYAELRARLAIDTTLNPELRNELARRADWLAMNPFEDSLDNKIKIARLQHAALVKWAQSPQGAPAELNKDRREELALLRRSEEQRVWATTARLATAGLYKKRAPDVPQSYQELDERRRVATYRRLIEQLAESGPHPEVSFNAAEVRAAIAELKRLRPDDATLAALMDRISLGGDDAAVGGSH